jgi:uroporphyrinogen decarboxylase
MKHRERVQIALNHDKPDRCPMHLGFTPEFAERLKKELKINEHQDHNPHGGGNSYLLERMLDVDMLISSVGWANSYYQEKDSYVDEWGISWKSIYFTTPFGKGRYTDISEFPLANDAKISSYKSPDPNREALYAETHKTISLFKNEYWIAGAAVTTIFETAWALRGLEQMLMDFVVDPDLANSVLDIPYLYHKEVAKNHARLGVDMIWLGDDVGSQNGMMISPEIWRQFLKPRMASIVSEVKAINPNVKVAYHSDGDVRTIIPELIEIGIDILNPIQPLCMNPAEIKKKYGDKLCFWGSIDEQHTLPFGKTADVRKEVIERLDTIGKNGGLIIGPTHHIQLDTPMENFHAMVDTILTTKYK